MAISDNATQSTIFLTVRGTNYIKFCRKKFPVPAGPGRKKVLGLQPVSIALVIVSKIDRYPRENDKRAGP